MNISVRWLHALLVLCVSLVAACGQGDVAEDPVRKPLGATTAAPSYDKDDLYRFFAIAFGAAPGVTYMSQLEEAANFGLSIKQIVNIFTTKPQFLEVYPASLSDQEFAQRLISGVVGTSATEASRAEAVRDIVAALSLPTWTRGDVIFEIFNNLAKKRSDDLKWGSMATKLVNQVAYAKHFTETMKIDTVDILQLRAVVQGITEKSLVEGVNLTIPIANAITDALNPLNKSSLSVSISSAKSIVGATETIKWETKNITSCQGIEGIDGQLSTNGSLSINIKSAGQLRFTILCTGVNGTLIQTASLIVPIPVQATSYLNAKNLNFPPFKFPEQFKDFKYTDSWADYAGAGVALADFEQNGTLSMVWFSNRGNYGLSPDWPFGRVYFYKFNEQGGLTDITSSLIDDIGGCQAPRKVLIADFNGDGKPDVFASCHGSERGDISTWQGENVRVLLSQPSGKYSNTKLPVVCYCHSAAAADINGDGYVDILTANQLKPVYGPNYKGSEFIALINDGTGNFSIDYQFGIDKMISPWPRPDGGATASGSPTIELIDVNQDGQSDLVVGGYTPRNRDNFILYNNRGRFDTINHSIRIPLDIATIDIIYSWPNIYFYGSSSGYQTQSNHYMAVLKYNIYSRMTTTIWYSQGKRWTNTSNPDDFVWVMPHDGYIAPYCACYDGVKIPL